MPCTDDSGIPFELDSSWYDNDDDDARANGLNRDDDDGASNTPKKGLRGLILRDLFGELENLWDTWIDSEREIHYISHDGGVCDYEQGFPDHCLDSDDEGSASEKAGVKMTREEHLDDVVERASEEWYLDERLEAPVYTEPPSPEFS